MGLEFVLSLVPELGAGVVGEATQETRYAFNIPADATFIFLVRTFF